MNEIAKLRYWHWESKFNNLLCGLRISETVSWQKNTRSSSIARGFFGRNATVINVLYACHWLHIYIFIYIFDIFYFLFILFLQSFYFIDYSLILIWMNLAWSVHKRITFVDCVTILYVCRPLRLIVTIQTPWVLRCSVLAYIQTHSNISISSI